MVLTLLLCAKCVPGGYEAGGTKTPEEFLVNTHSVFQFSLLSLIFSHPFSVVAPHIWKVKAQLVGRVGQLSKLAQVLT